MSFYRYLEHLLFFVLKRLRKVALISESTAIVLFLEITRSKKFITNSLNL